MTFDKYFSGYEKPIFIKNPTRSEVEALHRKRVAAGAVGRNAFVCKCGHIDYRPNSEMFSNNIVHHKGPCVECREVEDETD
jgi:hypothetical protein